MGLADHMPDNTGIIRPRPGRCVLAQYADTLDEEDAPVLQTWLASPTVSAAAITNALKAHGFNVSKTTVKDHRRGDCACKETETP